MITFDIRPGSKASSNYHVVHKAESDTGIPDDGRQQSTVDAGIH